MPKSSATTRPRSSTSSNPRLFRWASRTSKRALWSAPPTTLMSKSPLVVRDCWLGRVPDPDAWDLQVELVEGCKAGTAPDTLLLLKHPHVFTLGRRGTVDHVLWDETERRRREVELVWSDRGGDATYHGPGQLVGYPVLDLAANGLDLLDYLRRLEGSLISYLRTLGVEGAPVPGLTGVWVGDAKVAAIGVKSLGGVVAVVDGEAVRVRAVLERTVVVEHPASGDRSVVRKELCLVDPEEVKFIPGNPSAGVGPRQWRRLPGKPPQP